MRQRLLTLQKLFLAVLPYGLFVVGIGLPLGNDGQTTAVLQELQGFEQGFNQAELEKSLLAHAQGQGHVALSEVAAAVPTDGYPKVAAAKGAKPIDPVAAIDLSTLEQAHTYGRKGAAIEVVSPKAQALGPALAWRLTRSGGDSYTLLSAEVEAGVANSPMIAREQETFEARVATLATDAALAKATIKLERSQALHDSRIKWHAPWKAVLKAREALTEAKTALSEAQKARDDAHKTYEDLATLASNPKKSEGGGAIVTLKLEGGGKSLTFAIPAPVNTQLAPVPVLSGVEFAQTKQAGLWDTLKDETAGAAIAQVEALFSWHYGPLGVGLLNGAPIGFLLLLTLLIRKGGNVGGTYNPFGDNPEDETMPSVGFGSAPVDLMVLVLLPLCASGLCAWSLFEVDQLPVLPLLAGIGSAGLGLWAYNSLAEARRLSEAVRMSHTSIPPAYRP